MEIIKKLKWRYACKKFDANKKLSTSQIETIKNAFNLTATSFGLQPLKMLVIKDDSLKNKLLPHAFNQQQVSTCSHLLVICIDTEINETTIHTHFELEKEIRGVTEESISGFKKQLKGMFAEKSNLEIEKSSIQQAYLALGNLMTVCAIEKIDSCPMEGFLPHKFDEELKLSQQKLKAILLLPVGFRAEDDFMSKLKKVRKPIEETIIEL